MNRRSGFTLIEMLTTVAGLVIVLGLMVSLARYVRSRSADKLTRELLIRLEEQLEQTPAIQAALDLVPPLVHDPGDLSDQSLQLAALENNKYFVLAWNQRTSGQAFRDLPLSVYDELTLRDAWGTPIVYMAPKATNIGIMPQNRRFFLSAGPDRNFETRVDNLYSYERAWER